MQKIILVVAFVAVLFIPQTTSAEIINYGEFISYNGKIDGQNNPNGKGKLELSFGALEERNAKSNKDILSGIFENTEGSSVKVTNAKLSLANRAKFKGTLKYYIEDGGKSISYMLLEGTFMTSNLRFFDINSTSQLTIIRTPQIDGCKTIFKNDLYEDIRPIAVSTDDIPKDYFSPLIMPEKNKVKNAKKRHPYVLNNNFEGKDNGYEYSLELTNGGILYKKSGNIIYQLPNRDWFILSTKASYPFAFKKTFTEGVVKTNADTTFFSFIGNNGETGMIEKSFGDNGQVIFDKIMNQSSIQGTGYKIYTGKIASLMMGASKDDGQAQYDLAMAYIEGNEIEKDKEHGRYWINQAEKNGNKDAIAYIKAEKEANEKLKEEILRARKSKPLSPVGGEWKTEDCPGPDVWHESPLITEHERQCIWKFNPNQTVTVISHLPYLADINGTRVYITYTFKCDCGTWKKDGDEIILTGYPTRRNCAVLGFSVDYMDQYTDAFKQKIKAALPNIKKEILSYNNYDQISGIATMDSPDQMELIISWQNPYKNIKDILRHRFDLNRVTLGMTAAQKAQYEKDIKVWNEQEEILSSIP